MEMKNIRLTLDKGLTSDTSGQRKKSYNLKFLIFSKKKKKKKIVQLSKRYPNSVHRHVLVSLFLISLSK